MKFFIDTADVDAIRELHELGMVDGVTTNPSLILKSGRDILEVTKEICSFVKGPVSAEVVALMQRTEEMIRARGGRRVYIETSSRPQYEPTRGFYRRCGYHEAAHLPDFYGPGDGKLIYVRGLED